MKLTFLGHSFFSLGFSGGNVLIDPFIFNSSTDENFKSLIKCPYKREDFKDVSLILISHEHFDHFDKKSIEFLASKFNALVVGHESVLQELSLPKNLLKPVQIGDNLTLRGTEISIKAAHHPQSFYPLSFLIKADNQTVFHAGDTSLMDELADIKADVALLPIGGTFTMDVVDAVRATKTMKPKQVVPMHYNTFGLIKADPHDFRYRIEKSILVTKPIILEPGQTIKL